jgi:hypothetical protein
MRCAPVIFLNFTSVPGADVALAMVTAKGAVESAHRYHRWALTSLVHSGSVVSQVPPERIFAQMAIPSACRRSILVSTLNTWQPRLVMLLLHLPEMLSTKLIIGAFSGKNRSAQFIRMPFCDVHSQSLASHWLLPMASSITETLRYQEQGSRSWWPVCCGRLWLERLAAHGFKSRGIVGAHVLRHA